MNKIALTFSIVFFSFLVANAQDYRIVHDTATNQFNQQRYLDALNSFIYANSLYSKQKFPKDKDPKIWIKQCQDSLRILILRIQDEKEKSKQEKTKAEKLSSYVIDLLKEFLPKDVKNVYEYYDNRADSFFISGNYENALFDYKAAEMLKGDENWEKFKLKKKMCEELNQLRIEASILFYEKSNFEEAGKIYAQILDKNIKDRNARLMLNFSKMPKEQEFIEVPSGSLLLKDSLIVKINSFKISPYEVTNAQFARFLNEYKSNKIKEGEYKGQSMIDLEGEYYPEKCRIYIENGRYKIEKGYELHPVIYVTWFGANEYALFYGLKLPTESQWAFAAGYGILERFEWAGTNEEKRLSEYAWYIENSQDGTKPVGLLKPNELGIFDMSGNAWEWCSSVYVNYDKNYLENAEKITNYYVHVQRGGGWGTGSKFCRVMNREPWDLYDGQPRLGFRVVLAP